MTLLNYTDPIPLPVPVTSGSTIQSYTDPLGDVWVAKNGVNSGNWSRARDVLFCRVYRNAPYTLSASPNGQQCPFDTAMRDVYGMFTAPTITLPIAGLWHVGAVIELANTAANQVIGYYLGGTGFVIRSTISQEPGTAYPLRVQAYAEGYAAAGVAVSATFEYTTASLAMTVGQTDRSAMWVMYQGTG